MLNKAELTLSDAICSRRLFFFGHLGDLFYLITGMKSLTGPYAGGDLGGYEDPPQYAKKVHIFCILYADIVDLFGVFLTKT